MSCRHLLVLLAVGLALPAAPALAGLDVEVPGPLDFRRVEVGGSLRLRTEVFVYGAEPDSMDVVLSPAGGPFTVVSGGGFIAMQSTAAYWIEILYAPTAAGDFTATVDLGFGHGAFTVAGSAAVHPDCGLSSATVFFPGTFRYERSVEYLTVTNGGSAAMVLRPATYAHPSFSVAGEGEITVAPGGSHVLEVRHWSGVPTNDIGGLDLGCDDCPAVQLRSESCYWVECADNVVLEFEDPAFTKDAKSPIGWPPGFAHVDERDLLAGRLVLRSPSLDGDVTGFQMGLVLPPEIALVGAEYPGQGVNLAGQTTFRVIYPQPLEVRYSTVVLATFTFLAVLPAEEAVLQILPYSIQPGTAPALRTYSTTAGSADFTPASGHEPVAWVEIASISDVPAEPVRAVTRLEPNVPNPFNPRTEIRWTLERRSPCRVTVHDLAGRLVRVLCDEDRAAGPHAAVWRGRDDAGRGVASGVYYVRLAAGPERDTRKITLLR